MASGRCKIVGICDVDRRALDPSAERVAKLTGDQPGRYRDYREMLEQERPEIVIVTTPDHWHALPTIAALKAGAQAYVNKPTAHTVGEGQAMVRAARVVQVGLFTFDRFTLTRESRLFGGNDAEKGDVAGMYFHGTKGTFRLGHRGGWVFYPAGGGSPQGEKARRNEPDAQNIREFWADFLAAIETGSKPARAIADAHRATTCALMGMVSLKARCSVVWDATRETILGDAEAAKPLRREYRKGWECPV